MEFNENGRPLRCRLFAGFLKALPLIEADADAASLPLKDGSHALLDQARASLFDDIANHDTDDACSYLLEVRSSHALLFPDTSKLRLFAVSTLSGVPHCCSPTSARRDRGSAARRTRNVPVSEDEIAALVI